MATVDGTAVQRLVRVPLREVWKHEAYDFSAWLVDNLDVLNEHLEVPLVSADTEQAAGAFSVDILAEDEDGKAVVVENQLERSNHDHLGKLITYLASYEAVTAIWIVSDPRPEHVAAVTWLNDSAGASFYLFKVEAVRIGSSFPAPLLTRIVGPSATTREIASTKKERSERQDIRRRFWTELLDHARSRNELHSGRSAPSGPYLDGASGIRGLRFSYGVGQHRTSVMLWIDRGQGSGAQNLAAFEVLYAARAAIESDFGHPLDWQSGGDETRSCKLRYEIDGIGWRDESKWNEAIPATVAEMERLAHAIKPHLPAVRECLVSMPAVELGEDDAVDEDEFADEVSSP